MGKFLNEYEELKLLGKGSFAKIYKVRHLELDYIRAIRVLNETVSDNDNDNKVYQSFINECKTLLKLGNGGHPNIVRIYQPRKLQNHALVEMDYIDGCDLEDYLLKKRKFVPVDEVMRFVREISGALAYCHVDCYEYLYDKSKEYEYKLDSELKGQKFRIGSDPNDGKKDLINPLQQKELIREYGITHNDLHSKNIMRKRYDGSYILLDFGLAIQNGRAIKSSSRRDGAVEYRAPEKGNREGIISERSDIYSFGILMYEMLAGQVPFPFQRDKYSKEEEALFKLSLDHENTPPPVIEPLRRAAFEAAHHGKKYEKDYPDWLEQVIMKCLAKKPEDRYANGKELFLEIEKYSHLEQTSTDDLIKLKDEKKNLILRINDLENEKKEFDNQINSLAKQFARTTSDAEKSTEENSGLKEKIQGLIKERDDFQDKITDLSKQLLSLSEKNAEVNHFADDLQIKLESEEERNKMFFVELKNLKKERDDYRNKNINLSEQISILSAKNEEITKQANSLQSQLFEDEKRYSGLFEELEDLKKDQVILQNKNDDLSKQVLTLSEKNAKASQIAYDLQIKLEDEGKSNNALSMERAELRKERDDLRSENVNLLNQISFLSAENDDIVKQTNDLQIQLAESEKNKKAFVVELEDLKKERNDINRKNKDLLNQLSTLSVKSEEVIKLANSLQIQLAEGEKNKKVLVAELGKLKKERDEFQNNSENLSKQVSVFSEKADDAAKLANDLKIKLEEKEKSNQKLTTELKDVEKKQVDLKNRNEKLSKQVKEAPEKSSTKRWKIATGIAALFAIVLSVAYMNKPMSVDNSNYETTISQQKTTIDNLQSEKSQLQNHLMDANNELDQLKNQVGFSGKNDAADIIKKQQEIDNLKKDNTTLKSSINEKNRTISKQKEELQTAQKTINKLLGN